MLYYLYKSSAHCYMQLQLFEDAIINCDMVIQFNSKDEQVLYYKAISLAYLFKFDESRAIFESIDLKGEIEIVN